MPLALSLIDSFTSTAVHCYSHSSAAATAPITTTTATGVLPTAARLSYPLESIQTIHFLYPDLVRWQRPSVSAQTSAFITILFANIRNGLKN